MQSFSAFLVLGLLAVNALDGQTLFPTEPKLRPTGVFNLASKLSAAAIPGGVIVTGMQSKQGKLFFLATTSGSSHDSFLVRTSLNGDIKYAVKIGAADDILDWAVTDSGEAVVETQSENSPPQLRRYLVNGDYAGASPITRGLLRPARAGSAPFQVTASGAVVGTEGSHSQSLGQVELNTQNVFNTHVVSLPNDRLAIIDAVRATVTFVNLRTAGTVRITLEHPEVARVRQSYENGPASLTGLAVIAAAADAEGNVYCMLAGFQPDEGAPVIVLDTDGHQKVLFRCPVVNPGTNKPVVPDMMALTNGQLFIGDGSGVILSFGLPKD